MADIFGAIFPPNVWLCFVLGKLFPTITFRCIALLIFTTIQPLKEFVKMHKKQKVIKVETTDPGTLRQQRIEYLDCGHTRIPGWKNGNMMSYLEVGEYTFCSSCKKNKSR